MTIRSAALALVLSLGAALAAGAQDPPAPPPPPAPQEPPAPPPQDPEEGEAAPATAGALLLRGCVLHDASGPPRPGTSILIVDGKVAAVGPDGALGAPVPEGAERLFLAGQHVYPGLIDADTVLGLTEIGAVAATNDTSEVGAVNPNLRAELAVNPDSELLPVARTGGVLLAVTSLQTGLVSGTSALIRLDGWTWEDLTVRAPLMLHVRWPGMRIDRAAQGKDGPAKQVEAREASLRALDDALQEARAYARARQAMGAPRPDVDPKWEAMRDVVERRIPIAVVADDLAQLRAALDWADREGLRIVIVGGQDAWRCADALAWRDVPVILGSPFALPRRDDEPVDAPYRNAARLHAAGVRIAFSTGGDAFSSANSRNLRLCAAQAVAYGLPPEAALRALTLGAAEILGVADRVGSLEVGKEATLFAASGDILETPTEVTAAWVAGRSADLTDRQRRLYERYRRRR